MDLLQVDKWIFCTIGGVIINMFVVTGTHIKGEKDPFAYLLCLFSFFYGVIFCLMGTADNISTYFVYLYISLELSVMGWLLSVHYIESAIKSGEMQSFTLK